jgi:serine/threonine protein kinase
MAQLGRYEILQRLARGSVADVLLARASGLEGFARHVVIKQIRAEHAIDTRFVKAFLDEARISGSLNHHNIVQVFDIDQVDGSPFFAMEYVHGEDVRRLLAKVVSKGKQVPIEIVVAIGAAASAGLHHAHEQHGPDRQPLNLVHRDVSPSNILIGYDGSVKLVDFGLAKPALSGSRTRSGALGKAPYMSPELCMGKPVDRRSDVFALGIVLYELVTARRLFKGDNDYHTMSMIVEGTVPPPSTLRPELPTELDEIIMRALAKAPAARYQSAYDLRGALESLAIDRELRTTAKAVADYLASVFGARPEPWHAPGGFEPAADNEEVDFDSMHGLVPTPSNGMRVLASPAEPGEAAPPNGAAWIGEAAPDAASPIALAREVALGNTPDPDAPSGFEEQATRLDLPPEQEETATVQSARPQRPPATPSSVPTRLAPPILPETEPETFTGARSVVESTTTAAQPIVDVLTGVQPQVNAGDVHRTAEQRTLGGDAISESFGARTGLTTEARTVEDAFPPHGIDPTQKQVSVPASIPPRPAILMTPPGSPQLERANPSGKRTTPPFPPVGNDDSGRRAMGSPQHGVQASPHGGSSNVQAGPHGAIVPVLAPQAPQITRADTDAADEATTVEPPLFPMPEPEIEGLPPESVYIPPPRPEPLPLPMLKRWGLVGAVLLIPLVIGLLAHACRDDAKPAAVPSGAVAP